MPLGFSLGSFPGGAEAGGEDAAIRGEVLRILLVDDDQIDRMAVVRALGMGLPGAEIEQCDRAATALERLRATGIDCVVLDYMLPDGDAGEMLAKLREYPRPVPPVVVLTRQGNESVAVDLLKAGATDYLPKQKLSPEGIGRAIRYALRLHRAEMATQLAHAELERRVVERTLELENANRRLESEMTQRLLAEAKAHRHLEQLAHFDRLSTLGEMAAALAHEIHQPLGAIVNFARGCERLIESGNADAQVLAATLSKITGQAERAAAIIRRQRDLASRHEQRREPAELATLIREVVELISAQMRAAQVEVELDLDTALPRVLVDPIQVQQVVLNLLRNGLEAMTQPACVERRLSVRTAPLGTDRVEVTVADRGCGWPAGELEQLFESFFSTKQGGMGLGLAICRSIVEAHGGQLIAEPNPERGLRLRFDLPTAGSSAANG